MIFTSSSAIKKLSTCLTVCVFVPKNLANCWTDMVLLYSLGHGKVYSYFPPFVSSKINFSILYTSIHTDISLVTELLCLYTKTISTFFLISLSFFRVFRKIKASFVVL